MMTPKLKNGFLKVVGLSFLFASLVTPAAPAFADDDEYNFSWLDPEKKIYVLQNRKYRKAKKVNISLMGGAGIAETYRRAWQVEPRLGVWFNEDFGIEGFYAFRINSENNSYKALRQALGSGTSPLIREVNSMYGLLFNWAPWYAKINVFNTILYFDWYFSIGAGMMNTSIGPNSKTETPVATVANPIGWRDESLFAAFLGTGQLFHLSQHFDMRLDFLGHFYSSGIYGGQQNAPTDKSLFSNFVASLGIGVKL